MKFSLFVLSFVVALVVLVFPKWAHLSLKFKGLSQKEVPNGDN